MTRWLDPAGFVALASACGGARAQSSPAPAPAAGASASSSRADTASFDRAQYVSTYRRRANPPVLIRNATVLTAAGQEIRNASVLFRDGKIVSVGAAVSAPSDAVVVDGSGKFVTPGIIDTHSHLGVYAAPGTQAESDGNEATNPVTAEVWAEHSIWPHDPQIPLAIAGGVTVMQVLPGSANIMDAGALTQRAQSRASAKDIASAPRGCTLVGGANAGRSS